MNPPPREGITIWWPESTKNTAPLPRSIGCPSLGKAYTQLASRHRVAASALERGQQKQLTFDGHFSDWIFSACEFSAQAERLLALEVELARSFGVHPGMK